MRLGIFGGTFDPPHIGHLTLAADAVDQLELDLVLWVLTHYPPHKQTSRITPLEDRIAMVKATIEGNDDYLLSRVDIDRPAPHYAVETVRFVKREYKGSELIYLMGGDSLESLPEWYLPDEFVRECNEIGIMERSGYRIDLPFLELEIPGLLVKLRCVRTSVMDISASQIRDRIKTNRPFRHFLHPAVYEIITRRNLYQDSHRKTI